MPSTVSLVAASVTDDTAEALVRIGAVLVVALVASWLATRVLRRAIHRAVGRGVDAADELARQRADARATTIAGVLGAIARLSIWAVAVMLVAAELGFDLAPLIAGAGIIGLAVGFGAQGLVSDVVSGLFMLVEDQYGVGDWVDVGETSGVVEGVGLRTTLIRDLDGLLWTVRNGLVARTANANRGFGRAVVDVGVGYGADLRRAQEIIGRVAEETRDDPGHAAQFLDAPEVWGVQELGDDAVTVRLVCTTRPGAQWALGRELRLRVKEALDAAGIEIPFPQRAVWLRTEPGALDAPLPVAVSDGP